jgi:hypothetical protein
MNKYLIFDPIQQKELGGDFVDLGFKFRYLKSKKFGLINRIYVPNGPILTDIDQIEVFLEYLSREFRFSKIKVDLPLILDADLSNKFTNLLDKSAYKKNEYYQDNETILISKNNQKIDNKEVRYYIRKASAEYDFQVIEHPNLDKIDRLYKLYLESSKIQNFTPKSKNVFISMANDSYIGVALNKKTNEIDAFVWGLTYKISKNYSKKEFFNILNTFLIGTNENARKFFCGYGTHNALFKYALEDLKVDFIDLQGASRTQNRKYLKFKNSFGGEFHTLAGSYEKLQLI